MQIIARCYGDVPALREVCAKVGRLVYIRNSSAPISQGSGPVPGVGFPVSAIFRYDSKLLFQLEEAHSSGDKERLKSLWKQATPFDP